MVSDLDTTTLDPMLACSTARIPEGDEWRYEPKWDGMRALVVVDRHGEVLVQTRAGRDISSAFPELQGAPASLGGREAVFDGELVALEPGTKIGSFQRLQGRIGVGGARAAELSRAIPVYHIAFDLLALDGKSLLGRPLDERRARLDELLDAGGADRPWLLCPRITSSGAQAFKACLAAGHEGMVAKVGHSAYVPGMRDVAWRKVRLRPREEFVVAGWFASREDAARPGSLVIATRPSLHAPLEFAGRVTAGIGERERELLHSIFLTRSSDQPTAIGVPQLASLRHVQPQLVVDVAHAGWNAAGELQQPHYLGLRPDRSPESVVRDPTWR